MTTYNLVGEENLKSKVELNESFENRLAVSIKNVSFVKSETYDWLIIFYELHSVGSSTLSRDIKVKIVIYNKKDEIMAVEETAFLDSSFYEFDVVEAEIRKIALKDIPKIGKIKIFPIPY